MKFSSKLAVPNATAFIASFCIMVVEIIAGRIIARYLGASLYTWTSVIGVVLTGIALGNYIGGRLVDRFKPPKMLCLLFALAAISCLTVPLFNRLVGEFHIFWLLPWSFRIALHVICVFFLPSLFLGMVGPVVAKFALDKNLPTGLTVGNVYAFSALGSIAGTFSAGFLLIPAMGMVLVIWIISGILALMSLLYYARVSLFFFWAVFFSIFSFLSLSTQSWAKVFTRQLGLTQEYNPRTIYEKESRYSLIKIDSSNSISSWRKLIIDQLLHGIVNIKNPADIESFPQYSYISLSGKITKHLSQDRNNLNVLFLGGGGYVLPRYIEKNWPQSYIEVVEIDPAVTQACQDFLGLSRTSSINIHHMDARNYVDELLWEKKQAKTIRPFDFIYGDAISGFSVPYQLTTYEFNEKVRSLLAPEGIYIVNVIDNLQAGRFLGAIVNTFEKSFSFVYVFSGGRTADLDYAQNTFIVIGSMKPIDFEKFSLSGMDGIKLDAGRLTALKESCRGVVLTDDYAPVESFLAPLARRQSIFKLLQRGNDLLMKDRFDEAISWYNKSLKVDPYFIKAYDNIGLAYARQGKLEEAGRCYEKVLDKNPHSPFTYNNLGNILRRQGEVYQAMEYYRKGLDIYPYPEIYNNLGITLAQLNRVDEAIEVYRKGLKVDNNHPELYNNLGNALFYKGDLEEAADSYRRALDLNPDFKQAYQNLKAISGQE